MLLYPQVKMGLGVPVVAQRKQTGQVSKRMWVQSLASLSGVRIQGYPELRHRGQMQLGSGIAVAVV